VNTVAGSLLSTAEERLHTPGLVPISRRETGIVQDVATISLPATQLAESAERRGQVLELLRLQCKMHTPAEYPSGLPFHKMLASRKVIGSVILVEIISLLETRAVGSVELPRLNTEKHRLPVLPGSVGDLRMNLLRKWLISRMVIGRVRSAGIISSAATRAAESVELPNLEAEATREAEATSSQWSATTTR